MSYSHILFHVEESGIALLTVNRPEKLNALSGAVIGELADAFGQVASDGAIRAVIVTGAGEKAFVAGADIRELAELSPYDARAFALRGQATWPPTPPAIPAARGTCGTSGYCESVGRRPGLHLIRMAHDRSDPELRGAESHTFAQANAVIGSMTVRAPVILLAGNPLNVACS